MKVGVGRHRGHYHQEGYVDARNGKIGGELSDEACQRLMGKLDAD
jgi:hypothetical protein